MCSPTQHGDERGDPQDEVAAEREHADRSPPQDEEALRARQQHLDFLLTLRFDPRFDALATEAITRICAARVAELPDSAERMRRVHARFANSERADFVLRSIVCDDGDCEIKKKEKSIRVELGELRDWETQPAPWDPKHPDMIDIGALFSIFDAEFDQQSAAAEAYVAAHDTPEDRERIIAMLVRVDPSIARGADFVLGIIEDQFLDESFEASCAQAEDDEP